MMSIASLFFLEINSDEYINIFKKYDEYFSNFSIVGDVLRQLGWMILKGLLKLTSLLNTMLSKIFDFINFLQSDEFIRIFNLLKPFIWTVFLLALVYLSYCYIFAHEKPKGVVTNVLLFVGTIILLPYMMVQMNKLVTYGKELLQSDVKENNYELLQPYITDLVYLDSIDFDENQISDGKINGYTGFAENIRYLKINEVMDPGDYKLENKDLFKKELTTKVKNGKEKLKVTDIKKNKFFFVGTTPYYYRYHVNFFVAALYLLALILVMAFSSIKLVQLIYELAAEKVLAPFIAAGDLTGGQKIRKALIGILNGYITILCVLFLQRLFILSTEYINLTTWSDNAAANGFIKTVMILAGALFIIDGPNFFEQIFGIDAGLKSVGQALQSAYYASQMFQGTKHALTGALGKVAETAKKTGKNAVGGAAGLLGVMNGMGNTGSFDTNNEKVSQELAETKTLGTNQTAGKGSLENSSSANGEGVSGIVYAGDVNAEAETAMVGTQEAQQSPSSDKKAVSGITADEGRRNLAGAGDTRNQDVNEAINNALNQNAKAPAPGGQNENPERDNVNLANWAMNNTRAGRFLQSSYEKGKSFGQAAGNTMNQINYQSDQTEKSHPQPLQQTQQGRDNLEK